jgi:hypothetical protein
MSDDDEPKRFRYEEAVLILDKYAREQSSLTFLRVHHKFKAVVASVAWVDFMWEGVSPEQALAWAWEDAQMAFVGRSDPMLNAGVLHLWLYVRKDQHDAWARTIKRAFDAAEAATSDIVPRRFLPRDRLKQPRRPEEGFGQPALLPCWGPRLREWSLDERRQNDPDELERQHVVLEANEREKLRLDKVTKANLALAKAAGKAAKKAGK